MENLSLAGKSISIFRIKKELKYIAMKDIKNIFRLKMETQAFKDRIIEILRIFLSKKKKKKIIIKSTIIKKSKKIFGVTIILNTKVTVMEIKKLSAEEILIKLDHT